MFGGPTFGGSTFGGTIPPSGPAPIVLALGLASESDSALPIAGRLSATLGLAAESDSALPITPAGPGPIVLALGLASESDSALPISRGVLSVAVGLASESDVALPFGVLLRRTLGLATETDSALPLGGSAAPALDYYLVTSAYAGVQSATAGMVLSPATSTRITEPPS